MTASQASAIRSPEFAVSAADLAEGARLLGKIELAAVAAAARGRQRRSMRVGGGSELEITGAA